LQAKSNYIQADTIRKQLQELDIYVFL